MSANGILENSRVFLTCQLSANGEGDDQYCRTESIAQGEGEQTGSAIEIEGERELMVIETEREIDLGGELMDLS